jgi:glycosyltransferase involved in cell wall biosynthesis
MEAEQIDGSAQVDGSATDARSAAPAPERIPAVSVCVPLYRKEAYIAETIRSVLAQTFTDFELIVLDNASPDRSAEIARSFSDPRLTVVENPVTIGPTENFAAAVALSRAPLVKVLCADDLLHPTCLERQVAVMAQDPALAMVTCRQDVIDESGRVLSHDRGLRSADLVGRQSRPAVVRRLVRHGGNPVGNVNNVVFRRAAFDAAGGFPLDTDFFHLDVSTWVRLLEHGAYHGLGETLTSFRIDAGSHSSGMGGRAIEKQRAFVAGLRRDNAGIVRTSDRLYGAARAPVTWLRHHMIFAAAGPASSPLRRAAAAALGIGSRGRGPDTGAPPRQRPDVAVLETDPTGHRLHYLAHVVGALGADRCTVLTSAAAARSEEYSLLVAPITDATVVLPGTGSPRELLGAAVDAAHRAGARTLVITEADPFLVPLLQLLLRRPRPALELRLLLMRTTTIGGPEPLRPATLVKPVLVALLRRFRQTRMFFLTDAFGVVSRRRGYPGLQPVRDPVRHPESEQHTRPSWFPPEGALVVGVFGVVSPRKNLPVLVAAVRDTTDAALVVAGRLFPEVRSYVDTDPEVARLVADGRMVVVDRLLEPAELADALAAADVVAVLHDNDSPSGIQAEAALRGTPSLVPTGGWLAEVVRATGTGTAVPLDPAEVAAGIARVARDRDSFAVAAEWAATRLGTTDFTDRLLGP